MPLILSPLLESDIPAFAIADERANEGWPFARAMEMPGVPRRVFVENWTRKDWGKDPTVKWMKVSEEETGEFVAVAMWKFPLFESDAQAKINASTDNSVAEGVPAQLPPVQAAEARNIDEAEDDKPVVNEALFAALLVDWKAFVAEHIGDQPFALLQVLMTDPKHQRRGAGSMLVKWGCDIADERGLLTTLTASAAGEQVYLRQGFEIKSVGQFDLRPYGVDSTENRRRMIRLPRKA